MVRCCLLPSGYFFVFMTSVCQGVFGSEHRGMVCHADHAVSKGDLVGRHHHRFPACPCRFTATVIPSGHSLRVCLLLRIMASSSAAGRFAHPAGLPASGEDTMPPKTDSRQNETRQASRNGNARNGRRTGWSRSDSCVLRMGTKDCARRPPHRAADSAGRRLWGDRIAAHACCGARVGLWHQPDQPSRSGDVRGKTGSGWQRVKAAGLTQSGVLEAQNWPGDGCDQHCAARAGV
jgi:hypothetical protein